MNPVLDLIQQFTNSYNKKISEIGSLLDGINAQMTANNDTVKKSIETIDGATVELNNVKDGSQRATSDFMTVEQLCTKYGISVPQIKAGEQKYYSDAEGKIAELNASLAEASRILEIAKQGNDDLSNQEQLVKEQFLNMNTVLISKLKEMIEALGLTAMVENTKVSNDLNIVQLENTVNRDTMVDVTKLMEAANPVSEVEVPGVQISEAPVIEDVSQPLIPTEISEPIIPETTAEKVSCPNCSAMISGNSTICPICNYDLTKKDTLAEQPIVVQPSHEDIIAKYQRLSTLGLSNEKIDTITTNVTPEAFNDMISILTVNGVDVNDIKDNIEALAYNSPSKLSLAFATLKEFGKNNDANAISDQADMIICTDPKTIRTNYEYLSSKGLDAAEISILDLCTIELAKKDEAFTRLGYDFMALRKQKPYMIASQTTEQLFEAFGIAKEMAGASL